MEEQTKAAHFLSMVCFTGVSLYLFLELGIEHRALCLLDTGTAVFWILTHDIQSLSLGFLLYKNIFDLMISV